VTRLVGALVGLGVLGATLGCSGGTDPVPTTLVDGSPARSSPVVLEGVDEPTVLTKVRRTTAGRERPGSRAASCLVALGHGSEASVVERIGASGASVTLLAASSGVVRGCDAVESAWCGRAFGRIDAGRLRDPRLSLTCRDTSGATVAFAWIQPVPAATYVVVDGPGYAEVYPVADGVPVRVTTLEASLVTSDATLGVGEHTKDGRRLRAYELAAHVAG
jgi:hypothetical protein